MADLEWEVTHKKSRLHKGRGDTPQAALEDLRRSFALGIADAQENLEREQKRLDKLSMLDALTATAPQSLLTSASQDCDAGGGV